MPNRDFTDARTVPLAACVELQTRLLENCFRDVSEEAALERPGGKVNNMTFLAAHLVDARRYLANLLGPEVENPLPQLGDGQGIDDFPQLPTVAEILVPWRRLDAVVRERLAAATPERLDTETEQAFLEADRSVLGAVAFLVTHETYHVGQLALLRRMLGLEAMTYD